MGTLRTRCPEGGDQAGVTPQRRPPRGLRPAASENPGLSDRIRRNTHWLDQAEIYFSVIQRKVLNPNDFTSLDQVRDRLAAFEIRYNAIARPFTWKFTRTHLGDLLRRIDTHDKTKTHALAA